MELLYRASRDGDKGTKFHDLCDNRSNGILILIKADKNIKFGGFTDAQFISYQNPEKKPQEETVMEISVFCFK